MSFGPELRRARTFLNLTQREMAERVGLTPAQICDFECGRRRPPSLDVIIIMLRPKGGRSIDPSPILVLALMMEGPPKKPWRGPATWLKDKAQLTTDERQYAVSAVTYYLGIPD